MWSFSTQAVLLILCWTCHQRPLCVPGYPPRLPLALPPVPGRCVMPCSPIAPRYHHGSPSGVRGWELPPGQRAQPLLPGGCSTGLAVPGHLSCFLCTLRQGMAVAGGHIPQPDNPDGALSAVMVMWTTSEEELQFLSCCNHSCAPVCCPVPLVQLLGTAGCSPAPSSLQGLMAMLGIPLSLLSCRLGHPSSPRIPPQPFTIPAFPVVLPEEGRGFWRGFWRGGMGLVGQPWDTALCAAPSCPAGGHRGLGGVWCCMNNCRPP